MKYKFLLVLLVLFTVKAFAQTVSWEQFNEIQTKLPIEKDHANKAVFFYRAALYYSEKENATKKQLDSAAILNRQSIKISRELGLKSNIANSLLLDGEIALKNGNTGLAGMLKEKALNYSLKFDLKNEAAAAYKSIALDIAGDEFEKSVGYFKKAVSLYNETGALYNEAEVYNELAIVYNNIDEPAASIKYAQQAIKIKTRIKRHDLYKEFCMLALNFRIQGNYKEALSNALKSERIAENVKADDIWLSVIYNLVGTIYSELNYEDKSVEYYTKAIALAKKNNDINAVTSITLNTARELYSRGKITKALDIANSGYKFYPGKDCDADYPAIFILLYCKQKKYDKARPYFEQLLQCDSKENNGKNKSHIEKEKMYYAMIHYLLITGQAGKTYAYIDKLKQLAKINNDPFNLAQLENAHFQADSATGNYMGAMAHLKEYKILSDSLFNINRTKQFADLQLKYETEKKDKNIKLLTQQGRLQQAKIYNAAVFRYIFIGSLIIMALFVGLLYNRSRLKQRANKTLQVKQQQINEQNGQLKKLLLEKEWLLKEIHHRVKNNLQIVISLLSTQSAYLDNEDALLAIQNSQHRMHAMSLIHQKLYQSDNLASIDMSWYIYELVNYLRESFDIDDKVTYKLDTECIELDVAQAVPLGLIINEAISNAIKYAFNGKDTGRVTVSLKSILPDTYRLVIKDDGVGLPEGFELQERESLGMDLMMGLTNQLSGTFELKNDDGLTVAVTFSKDGHLEEANQIVVN